MASSAQKAVTRLSARRWTVLTGAAAGREFLRFASIPASVPSIHAPRMLMTDASVAPMLSRPDTAAMDVAQDRTTRLHTSAATPAAPRMPTFLHASSLSVPRRVAAPQPLHRSVSSHSLRGLHTSPVHQSTTLLVGGLSIAAAALAARYGVQLYERATARSSDSSPPAASQSEGEASKAGDDKTASSSASSGGFFGAQAFARRFYKGGFEDKMSRREAALILGVRESATPERIRERHRKMLMTNHPDIGGSTFVAGKINEAKDLLLKGAGGRM